jgi:hypothetical protein
MKCRNALLNTLSVVGVTRAFELKQVIRLRRLREKECAAFSPPTPPYAKLAYGQEKNIDNVRPAALPPSPIHRAWPQRN